MDTASMLTGQQQQPSLSRFKVSDRITVTRPDLLLMERQVIHVEYLDVPIYSLDWSGSHLLVGSKYGLTRLYTVRCHYGKQQEMVDSVKITQVAEYTASAEDHVITFFLRFPYFDILISVQQMNSVVVPGKCAPNTVIRSVEFASDYSADHVYHAWQPLGGFVQKDEKQQASSRFLTVYYNRVNVWDALNEKVPLSAIAVKYLFFILRSLSLPCCVSVLKFCTGRWRLALLRKLVAPCSAQPTGCGWLRQGAQSDRRQSWYRCVAGQ